MCSTNHKSRKNAFETAPRVETFVAGLANEGA
jgi:hypothetical protein